MNALKLYHDLGDRGVNLEPTDDGLRVDAPAGTLTDEDRNALLECKPALLKFLSHPTKPDESASEDEDIPKSKARWAGSGTVRLFDPIEKLWHEVPSSMCLPGVIAEADAHRRPGKGAAS